MADFANFFLAFADPWLLFLVAAGTFAGIYIGAIPGLSVTMAASILISFTFKWGVNEALALIAGVFVGGIYGGSRTAILLNIPGAPSAIATAIDGYPLAKKGLAGEAIGLTTLMSVLGGFIGVLALALLAPPISALALSFRLRVVAVGCLRRQAWCDHEKPYTHSQQTQKNDDDRMPFHGIFVQPWLALVNRISISPV